MHNLVEPEELEQLGQSPVDAVEPEPTSAARGGDVESGQRVDGVEIGRHQPRDVEVDRAVRPIYLCASSASSDRIVRHR
jgi:hypothetical protein